MNDFSIRTTRSLNGRFFAIATDLHRERHDADVDAWADTRAAARRAVLDTMTARGYTFVPYRDL